MKGQWGKLVACILATGIVTTIITVAIPMIGGGGWLPDLISSEGRRIDLLFWGLIALSITIFALVMGIVVYTLINFRAEPGDLSDGEHIHGNARMEAAWIVIPSIIVFIVGFISFDVLRDNEIGLYDKAAAKDPGAATLAVDVRGFSFGWAFRYKDVDGNLLSTAEPGSQLVLPVDTVTRFNVLSCSGRERLGRIHEQVRRELSAGHGEHQFGEIQPGHCEREWDSTTPEDRTAAEEEARQIFAIEQKRKQGEQLTEDEQKLHEAQPRYRGDHQFIDVNHSFWVPEARLKIDAVAGLPTYVQWAPSRLTEPEDRFQVVCAELCGAGHNAMRTDMCVVDKDTFDWWLKLDEESRRPATCVNLRLLNCIDGSGSRDDLIADIDALTKNKPDASCAEAREAVA
jgi:heme/copper-type cytochrome/quinol oxidase subunit 2